MWLEVEGHKARICTQVRQRAPHKASFICAGICHIFPVTFPSVPTPLPLNSGFLGVEVVVVYFLQSIFSLSLVDGDSRGQEKWGDEEEERTEIGQWPPKARGQACPARAPQGAFPYSFPGAVAPLTLNSSGWEVESDHGDPERCFFSSGHTQAHSAVNSVLHKLPNFSSNEDQ